jgi:hypothetical protein
MASVQGQNCVLFFIPRPVTATKKKSKDVLLRTTGLPYGQLPASSFIIVLSLFDDLSPADYYI